MTARPKSAERHRMILAAIDHAEAAAGNDDRAFLDAFRQQVRAQASASARGGALSINLPTNASRLKSAPLDADPRYLRNVRALAKRTSTNARIIGGTHVVGKEFDDCVAVGNDSDFGCTGTLIAPNAVLTAGHCEVLHTRIFVGNDTSKRGSIYRVARHIRHPRWDDEYNNDLMLLVLEKRVTGVAPRALASSALIDAASDARVVGYGTTDLAGTKGYGVKQQTDVPIVSPACRGSVKRRSDSAVYGCHADKEIVAGKPLLLHDTCRGDSGGPLYIANKRGEWLLAGVTSRGTDLATTMCGDGGLYTRVDKYRTWISGALRQR